MTLTLQQQTAVTIEDRALLVEAGAGTGKTFVLTERFLNLLDRHPDWPLESIIAVTFTKKATRGDAQPHSARGGGARPTGVTRFTLADPARDLTASGQHDSWPV